MQDTVRKDILNVLEQAITIWEAQDYQALGELSNHVIHDASIFQDDDSVSVAVMVYALSKVLQRCREQGVVYANMGALLQQMHDSLAADKEDAYRGQMRTILDEIKKVDDKLKLYITEVLEKARVKKASKMHEHGISLARTAELLGVSQWELQDYIGKTRIHEEHLGVSAQARLLRARKWFA